MSSISLSLRIQALRESYKQTLALVHDLQRFPHAPIFTATEEFGSGDAVHPQAPRYIAGQDPDEKRVELGNEIHQFLKELEDGLELVRQDVDGDGSGRDKRRRLLPTGMAGGVESDHDQERNAAALVRLNEDIKSARATFRRAQLQAKRASDDAKRRHREELFAGRKVTAANSELVEASTMSGSAAGAGLGVTSSPRRKGHEKLTQDEITVDAANDVTRSLRRAHEMLSANLQQSQFAQQTLDESQEALRGLSESYGGTSDLLKNTRGLVGQLVRSNKSDTWYLLTSFYILAATLAWLVFRRLLYGPMWWLVWQPLKLMWMITLGSLGTIAFGGGGGSKSGAEAGAGSLSTTSSTITGGRIPTMISGEAPMSIEIPPKGAGWGHDPVPPTAEPSGMIETVSKMVEDATLMPQEVGEEGTSAEAKNTKKRMMEADIEGKRIRDEL